MMLVLGGVFERHPGLRVIMVENDAGWIHSRTSEHEDQLVQFREQVHRPPFPLPHPQPCSSRTLASARAF